MTPLLLAVIARTREVLERFARKIQVKAMNADTGGGGGGLPPRCQADLAADRLDNIARWAKFSDFKKRPGTQYPAHFPDDWKRQEKWKTVMKPIEVGLANKWENVTTEIIDNPAHKYVEVRL